MPFDLNAVIAEQPKAKRKKPFTFTFDDQTYTMQADIDALGLRAANTGDMVTALQRALGPEQYAQLAQTETVLEHEPLIKLMTAYYDHIAGLTAGESSASSTSSKSTARPSKRTSKRTTKSASRRSVRRT